MSCADQPEDKLSCLTGSRPGGRTDGRGGGGRLVTGQAHVVCYIPPAARWPALMSAEISSVAARLNGGCYFGRVPARGGFGVGFARPACSRGVYDTFEGILMVNGLQARRCLSV